nr:zinc finger C2H2 type [Hymenolepis microstoma]
MSEVSAYIQPDHFDSDKKNVNDFLGQNPLLLLARTCQNIGVETKSSSSTTSSLSGSSVKSSTNGTVKSPSNNNSFSISSSFNKVFTNRNVAKASTTMVPPVQTFPPHHAIAQHSPKTAQSNSIPPLASTSTEDSGLYIPPSSNSLIQLARLSSSLKIPSPTPNLISLVGERQKRSSKTLDVQPPNSKYGTAASSQSGVRLPKRARRQSFGRTSRTSKPLDFSSHLSSHSSPLSTSSSSVSPSSLRSTPPSHISPPPPNLSQAPSINPASFEFMKNLATAGLSMPVDSCNSTSSNPLEAFFSVGSLLGASPDSLRELLVSIAHSLSERRAAETNLFLEHQQQQSKIIQGSVFDPSTQCLYCGHVCSDMSSLVQHIYTHLASLHKQQTESAVTSLTPPRPPQQASIIPPTSTSSFDLASFYSKLLHKAPESQAPPAPIQPPMVPSDPNSLFIAWLNLFRPAAYGEGLTGAANQ